LNNNCLIFAVKKEYINNGSTSIYIISKIIEAHYAKSIAYVKSVIDT